MGAAYHHPGRVLRTEYSLALSVWVEGAALGAESSWVMNRNLIWYLVTSIILGFVAKGMEHLVWRFVRCLVAVTDISLWQLLLWSILMEVYRSVDCISQWLERSLGVNDHSSSLPNDGTNHTLCDSIHLLRVRQSQFIFCSAGSGQQVVDLDFILPSAIISPKLSDVIAESCDSGLQGVGGGGAIFRCLILDPLYNRDAGIVVYE